MASVSAAVDRWRDAVHAHLMKNPPSVDRHGQILYHCGPVMLKKADGEWEVKAAGPTTSIREEPSQADVLRKYGVKAVIGKGGHGREDVGGCFSESSNPKSAVVNAHLKRYYTHQDETSGLTLPLPVTGQLSTALGRYLVRKPRSAHGHRGRDAHR